MSTQNSITWGIAALATVLLLASLPSTAQEGSGEAAPELVNTEEGTGETAPAADGVGEGTGDAAATPGEDPLPSIDEIMDHLNDLWRSDSSYAIVTMEVVTEQWSRTLEIESWSQGKDLALMIIRSPAREAGTATLKTDEGLWNYAPRADRLMRVPSGLLSESWMGSHFTNDDLMRESDYLDDFDTTLSWIEEEGTRLILATAIPHPEAPVVYSKIEHVMTPDQWLPVRSDYYDGDELVRTMEFSNVREIDGNPIPMTMLLIPHTDPGESTRVTYDTLELNAEVSSSLFTQRGLRRAAQR